MSRENNDNMMTRKAFKFLEQDFKEKFESLYHAQLQELEIQMFMHRVQKMEVKWLEEMTGLGPIQRLKKYILEVRKLNSCQRREIQEIRRKHIKEMQLLIDEYHRQKKILKNSMQRNKR